MSAQRRNNAEPSDAEVSRMLRQASDGYGDLPEQVGDRLDRVLDALPPADTLHAGDRAKGFATWSERLRPKRVQYAIASAAAAVLVTVGGVALAVQLTTGGAGDESGASFADLYATEGEDRDEQEEAPGATEASPGEAEGPQSESDEEMAADGLAGIETFATGSDYSAEVDLVAVLRELGADSTTGEIPTELADLAAGGDFWEHCEEAIVERYEGLLVAVDFARYESQPAIMALMVGEHGDIAVALTPACADGVIEPLAEQP